MGRAILTYAVVGWAILFGLDRLWPVWPVHAVAVLAAIVVGALAYLANTASCPRRP
jgi:MFS superfamily sulfate permease-like transporter